MTDRQRFRRFLALVTGYSISAYGNYLNLIALSLFTYLVTGSALGTGAVMALRLAAGFATGLVAGGLVTRFDRKALMIGSDLAQASAMVALVLAPAELANGIPPAEPANETPPTGWTVVLLCAAAVVLGAGNTLFTVALRSSVPEMVGSEHRVKANGWLVSGRSVATVLGFGSAGIIVGAGGFDTAFLLNAASFLVSAATLAWLPLATKASTTVEAQQPRESWLPAVLTGLAPVVLGMVLLRGTDALGSASHNVALPIYASEVRPAGPATFMSTFWASWAIGTLSAHQVVRRWSKRWSATFEERAFALGTCLMSVMFVAVFTGLPAPLLIAVALVAGLADGFTEIAYVSRLQAVPDERRGPLFGFSATAETAGFAFGMVTSAAVLEVLPALAVVALFHGVPLSAAAAFLLARARRRAALASTP